MTKKKVLFVDDETNILRCIQRELGDCDFDLLVAGSAREGLNILASEPIDIVVSDVKMPEMDGLQFLRLVKDSYPKINRIILSGFVEEATVISAIFQGVATTYFAKPWESEILRKTLQHILAVKENFKQKELVDVVNSIENLPGLPEIYNRFLEAVAADKPTRQIAKIIEKDISISARILSIANSAFYSNVSIASIERSLMHLGLNIVKDIMLAVSITQQLRWTAEQTQYLQDIFVHSSRVNSILHYLYEKKFRKKLAENFSSIGITHDLGKIILLQYFPQQYESIVNHMKSHPDKDFYQSEIDLGFENRTHAELGAYILDWWNLPDVNVAGALFHHVPEKTDGPNKGIIELLYLANEWLNADQKKLDPEQIPASSGKFDTLSSEEVQSLARDLKSKLSEQGNQNE